MRKLFIKLLVFAILAGTGLACTGPRRGTRTDIDKPLPPTNQTES